MGSRLIPPAGANPKRDPIAAIIRREVCKQGQPRHDSTFQPATRDRACSGCRQKPLNRGVNLLVIGPIDDNQTTGTKNQSLQLLNWAVKYGLQRQGWHVAEITTNTVRAETGEETN